MRAYIYIYIILSSDYVNYLKPSPAFRSCSKRASEDKSWLMASYYCTTVPL